MDNGFRYYIRPLLPLLGSLIAGIWAGSRIPGLQLWAIPPVSVAGGVICFKILRREEAALSPFALFFFLGYLSIQPWVSPNFSSRHVIHFLDGPKTQIAGIIDDHPRIKNGRLKLVLSVEAIGRGESATPAEGRINVTVAGRWPKMEKGDRVRFAGRIRSIRSFKNGGFDYRRYLAFRNIWGSTYTRGESLRVFAHPVQDSFYTILERFRRELREAISREIHGKERALVTALLTGERDGLSVATREAFGRAGVSHLLAISGLHIGIVAAGFFFLFSRLLSRFSFFLWRAWTRKAAALITIIPVLGYGWLAGMSSSTQRAVLMVGVFLLTFLAGRRQNGINTLGFAAMVILIVFPPALFDVSFQLSFAAVLAILMGMACLPVVDRGASVGRRAVRRVLVFLAVSFFAILGTFPLVMHYFNQFSFAALLSNAILIPMIGFVVVPVGIFSVFCYMISPMVAGWGFQFCGWVAALAESLVHWIAAWPLAAMKTITPNFLEIAAYYIFWVVGWHIAKAGPATGLNSGFLKNRLAVAVALAGVVFFAADGVYWYLERFERNDLRMTVIDVGQGSAALVEVPGGECVLVDGGGFSDNNSFDVGARIVAPFLWDKKIRTVETLVLSHPNSDHINGLTYIARHFHVKELWTNGQFSETKACREFLSAIEEKNICVNISGSVPQSWMTAGVQFTILHPQKGFDEDDTNNNSLVLKICFGDVSFLLPGDIMKAAEKELVSRAGTALKSTVLLAPHHGSRSSSTPTFLSLVDPQIVAISVGWRNRFRFPHSIVLERYRRRGIQIFRTDLHGAVEIETDGRRVAVEVPFEEGGGRSDLKFEVNPYDPYNSINLNLF